MNREKIGARAFGILLGFYGLDIILPAIGMTWFARTEAHLFWVALLLFFLPIMTSVVGMVLIYGTRKLSWWLAPIFAYSTIPVASLATVLLRSGTLVTVQEGARNTQGFLAGAVLSVLLVFAQIAFPIFIGTPIVFATLVWAKQDWKKLVAIPAVSFVILTGTFFLLLIDRV